MKLEYVEMVGFRGFRDKARFNLPSGFAVVSGHNGTGKSTLLSEGVQSGLLGGYKGVVLLLAASVSPRDPKSVPHKNNPSAGGNVVFLPR